MLTTVTEMTAKALQAHYAVGQFNLNNLEWTRAVLETADRCRSPVILGVTEAACAYMGGKKVVAAMVRAMDEALHISVPAALHLDHSTFEGCLAAMDAGFSSVMYDGSHETPEENLRRTAELVRLAHARGISVEAEVGAVSGEEDGIKGCGECADPETCRGIASLGIDLLAAGIGNVHGKYPPDWKGLRFDVLRAVRGAAGNVPLVLHGGSGIPEEQIREAIALGICKINVNTECQIAFAEATRRFFEEGRDREEKGYSVQKLFAPGTEAIRQKVREKMTLFGSVGKA